MSEQTQSVMQAPPGGGVHVKIERGQRGGYGWSLSVTLPAEPANPVFAFNDAIDALKVADARMRREFGDGGEA